MGRNYKIRMLRTAFIVFNAIQWHVFLCLVDNFSILVIPDYRRQPELLDDVPPDGPFSGILVILDEEAEAMATCCYGLCKNTSIHDLPIPQNKIITISYRTRRNDKWHTSSDYVMLIPVLNQPLSSNTYYAIQAKGKHQGEAHTSSTEKDVRTCCFCTIIQDVKSRPLDPNNPLQQFELCLHPAGCSSYNKGFESKCVLPGAFPPEFLRRKGWEVDAETPKHFTLGVARGIDAALRRCLPAFVLQLGDKASAGVEVGKWYVPFMFVRESWSRLKDQMKKCMYYEMVLEQRWEKVFEWENVGGRSRSGPIDATVKAEAVLLGSSGIMSIKGEEDDGWVQYRENKLLDAGRGVEVRLEMVERMKWEQKSGGWDGTCRKVVAEERSSWSRIACYVLVESFALKRMDGTLVISFDFYHNHRTKTKWK